MPVFGNAPSVIRRYISVEEMHFFLCKFCENVQIAVYRKGISRVFGYQRFGLLLVIEIPAEEAIPFVCDGGKSHLRSFFNHSAVAEFDLLTVFGDITPVILVTLRKEVDLFHDSDRDYHLERGVGKIGVLMVFSAREAGQSILFLDG